MFEKYVINKKWHLYLIVISILLLSLLPQESFPKQPFGFFDLIVHFVMYAGLTTSVFFAFYGKFETQKDLHFGTSVFIKIALFGALVEVLQRYLPVNRYFSFADIAANAFGASLIYIYAYFVKK